MVKCLSVSLLLLVGCTAVEYSGSDVGFISQRDFAERIRVDSVVLRDSVFIRERSDTVFYTRYRTLYKERIRVDTIAHCDTLYRDREIVVERVRDGGFKSHYVFKLSFAALLLFLLWRTGLWRVLWNFILKGIQLCKRVFRLKE